MKCFYHEDREAVAQCVDCNKGLCKECASKYKPILCDDCYNSRVEINAQKIEQENIDRAIERGTVTGLFIRRTVITLVLSVILTFILVVALNDISDSGDKLMILIFILAFGGFYYLSGKTRKDQIYESITGNKLGIFGIPLGIILWIISLINVIKINRNK